MTELSSKTAWNRFLAIIKCYDAHCALSCVVTREPNNPRARYCNKILQRKKRTIDEGDAWLKQDKKDGERAGLSAQQNGQLTHCSLIIGAALRSATQSDRLRRSNGAMSAAENVGINSVTSVRGFRRTVRYGESRPPRTGQPWRKKFPYSPYRSPRIIRPRGNTRN